MENAYCLWLNQLYFYFYLYALKKALLNEVRFKNNLKMFNSGRVNVSLDILGVHLHSRNFNLKIWLLVSFLNQIAV